MLGRWADIMLMAPLSCNTLAKMSNGICDNLLMAVYLSATCPVVVAPAMDEDMWLHPTTQKNLKSLLSLGHHLIPVESGELASGLVGAGRLAEPESIVHWLADYFTTENLMRGKKVLITAGPTYEPIDPVRFIGNHSSGKMGAALANTCVQMGASVTMVAGPMFENIPSSIDCIKVKTAKEMYDAVLSRFNESDIAILSAAVADYTVHHPADEKIKKASGNLHLELIKTPDILKSVGEIKTPKQILVGFALETNNEIDQAKKKLIEKNADIIVLNSLRDEGAGFGTETNKITIFDRKGQEITFPLKSKKEVASDIVQYILKYGNE
jgi:phosphopantothenoylcysteine decarboxylase/phosphopantothenate--cysteine ligase